MRADRRMYALQASRQDGGCVACESAGFLCGPRQARRVRARKAKSYPNRQKSLCILSHSWSLHNDRHPRSPVRSPALSFAPNACQKPALDLRQPERRPQQRRRPLRHEDAGRGRLRSQRPLASAAHRASTIGFLLWQSARPSRKSPRHARAPAQTMSALRFLGTSGPAASRSATSRAGRSGGNIARELNRQELNRLQAAPINPPPLRY